MGMDSGMEVVFFISEYIWFVYQANKFSPVCGEMCKRFVSFISRNAMWVFGLGDSLKNCYEEGHD